jgi:hypothetical protein
MENKIVRYRGIDITLTALTGHGCKWGFTVIEASGYECHRTFDAGGRSAALIQAKKQIDISLAYSVRIN